MLTVTRAVAQKIALKKWDSTGRTNEDQKKKKNGDCVSDINK